MPIKISCLRRKHLRPRSHNPVRQTLFQIRARNLWKSCLKICKTHLSLGVQVWVVESVTEELDNFAEGKNLLDPRRLVLSRFAGHERSRQCSVIWKMAAENMAVAVPGPDCRRKPFTLSSANAGKFGLS